MKILANHRLSPEQLECVQLTESFFNTPEFRTWFVKQSFSELGEMYSPSPALYEKYFKEVNYRFSWKIINRPWYKRWTSVIGWAEGSTIYTYSQKFYQMSGAERTGHFAHELMHIVGFHHSFEPSPSRAASLPYQIGDWIHSQVKEKIWK